MLLQLALFHALFTIVALLMGITFFTVADRTLRSAFLQRRYDPNVTGIWGPRQSIANSLKLIVSTVSHPSRVNKDLFVVTPVLPFSSIESSGNGSAIFSSKSTSAKGLLVVWVSGELDDLWKFEYALRGILVLAIIGGLLLMRQWLQVHKGNYSEARRSTALNLLRMVLAPHRCLVYAFINTCILTPVWQLPYPLVGNLLLILHGIIGTWVIARIDPSDFKYWYFPIASLFILLLWKSPLNYTVSFSTFQAFWDGLGSVLNAIAGFSSQAMCCADKVCDESCRVAAAVISSSPVPSGDLATRLAQEVTSPTRVALAADFAKRYPYTALGGLAAVVGIFTKVGLNGLTKGLRPTSGGVTINIVQQGVAEVSHVSSGEVFRGALKPNSSNVSVTRNGSGVYSVKSTGGKSLSMAEVSRLTKEIEQRENIVRSRQAQNAMPLVVEMQKSLPVDTPLHTLALHKVMKDPTLWIRAGARGATLMAGGVYLSSTDSAPTK